MDDDATSVTCKAILPHHAEVWSIATCPWDATALATGHSDADSGTHAATVWRMALPGGDAGSDAGSDADSAPVSGDADLEEQAVLRGHKTRVKQILWDPHASGPADARLLSVEGPSVRLWDVSSALGAGGASALAPVGRVDTPVGGAAGAVAWDPHSAHEIGIAHGAEVRWFDVRSSFTGEGTSDSIRSLHTTAGVPSALPDGKHAVTVAGAESRVRALSYNPNKPRQVLTGNEDGVVRIWDLRRLDKGPLKELHAHDHWVTAAAFNRFHDQLVLTAGADGAVITWRISSTSSAPLIEQDLEEEEGGEGSAVPSTARALSDTSVDVAQLHDDTVTAMAWSGANAWIHGSVSYRGRVVFRHVPSEEKYRILMV